MDASTVKYYLEHFVSEETLGIVESNVATARSLSRENFSEVRVDIIQCSVESQGLSLVSRHARGGNDRYVVSTYLRLS